MHHPTDRITHTTAFVTPVVEHWLEREIAQWVRPMKDRSDDPSHHERTLLPRSYISLPPYCRINPWQGPYASSFFRPLHIPLPLKGCMGPIRNNYSRPRFPVNLHQGMYLYVVDKPRVDYTLTRGPLGTGPNWEQLVQLA